MNFDEQWDDASMPEYTEMQKYAFVTKRAIKNNHIGYCYRENSDIKIDSGWRFLYGDEDEDYLDNPDNSETKDILEILEWKPQTKQIISLRRGLEFEWNQELSKFDQL